jgi:predicted dehydrogenase
MTPYRVTIIGLSGIGMAPPAAAPDPVLGTMVATSHASAYAALPDTEVVAVCDLIPERLDGFQRTWAWRFQQAQLYTDYRALLTEQRIDILSVVTPDDRHTQIVVDGVEAGVRGVFCEKPIATTLADADRIIATCAAHDVPLVINHTRRWYPEYVEARRVLRSGAIGPLQRIVATFGGNRAMLFRMGTHLVDTVCFFAGSEPRWVTAALDEGDEGYGPRYAGDGGHNPASEPGASACVGFANGVRAFVDISKRAMQAFSIDLIGAKGRLRIGPTGAETIQPLPDGRLAVGRLAVPQTTLSDAGAGIRELIGMIESGERVSSSSGEDGRRTLSILLGMLQSADAGGRRVAFPVEDR